MIKRLLLILFIGVSFASQAKLAPADFALKNTYRSVKLSPDGKHIASIVKDNGQASIAFISTESLKVVSAVRMPGKERIVSYYWANSERVVIKLGRHKAWSRLPMYYGELYATNIDGSKSKIIYGYRAGGNTTASRIKKAQPTRGWARIVNLLEDDEEHILISSTHWSQKGKQFADLHKLNIYSGKLSQRITRSPVPSGKFVSDRSGNVKLAYSIDEDRKSIMYTYHPEEKKRWRKVPQEQHGSRFAVYDVTSDGKQLIVQDNIGQDKVGVFSMSLADGSMKSLFTDSVVNISNVILSTDNSSTYAVQLDDGYPGYAILDNKHDEAKILKGLIAGFPGYEVNITSATDDGAKMIVFIRADDNPGTYYLYNKDNNKLLPLLHRQPGLAGKKLARTEPISFEASDGMTIHGYLTRPRNATQSQKLPMVVLVHGGPHGPRDYWGYDAEVQMLANEGYAVLRVNYRGSGGYGAKYMAAGYRHWGDHIMRDINEGTEYAIEQGGIDKDSVCIMGASFGGYAAVQAPTLAPELYKCIITHVGVSNLHLMNDSDIPDWYAGESYLDLVLGTNKAQLDAFSPVNNVAKLNAPVLIAHGKDDKRVVFENAEQLEAALKEQGKPYETYYKDGEGHGFYDEGNRKEYFERVAAFLKKYI